jgi:hypothetical protein
VVLWSSGFSKLHGRFCERLSIKVFLCLGSVAAPSPFRAQCPPQEGSGNLPRMGLNQSSSQGTHAHRSGPAKPTPWREIYPRRLLGVSERRSSSSSSAQCLYPSAGTSSDIRGMSVPRRFRLMMGLEPPLSCSGTLTWRVGFSAGRDVEDNPLEAVRLLCGGSSSRASSHLAGQSSPDLLRPGRRFCFRRSSDESMTKVCS